jgi:hypothetical protein
MYKENVICVIFVTFKTNSKCIKEEGKVVHVEFTYFPAALFVILYPSLDVMLIYGR